MTETKVVAEYIDRSFGFDVNLRNVTLRKVWGEWALVLNHNAYRDAVLSALVIKQGPLTGNQTRFIRQVFDERPALFASRCGASEAAVLLWEARGDDLAEIAPAVENRLRFVAFEALSPDARQLLIQQVLGDMSLGQVVAELGKAVWQALSTPKPTAPLYPLQALMTS